MKKLLAIAAAVALLAPMSAFAYSGGFSSGSSRSSYTPSSYSSSRSYSGGFSGSSFKSSGSFTGGIKSSAPSGLTNPVRSSGSYVPKTTPAPKPSPAPRSSNVTAGPIPVSSQTTVVQHVYSYNPFSGNFLFWYWMFGGFDKKPATIINNTTVVATSSPATSTPASGK